MSSLEPAIEVKNLSHSYKLYPSAMHLCLDLLRLNKILFWKDTKYANKNALVNLDFKINKGERIGIIGRNGAGKTTLLKILSGIIQPSSGEVNINGKIQSLMTSGLGFHPDFTGRENIHSSLVYNNLSREDYEAAVDDIISFCELGNYIDQPLKTYSLGMQSRLAFATATAIKPDILIIDEVLGAGDAYFTNKSVDRINKIISSNNTTLILVSHSIGQILKFCDKCIWINDGKIIENGKALDVVKSYDKYIVSLEEKLIREKNDSSNMPNISRWNSRHSGCHITAFNIYNQNNESISTINTSEAIAFSINFTMNESIPFCHTVISIYTESGVYVTMLHTKFNNINVKDCNKNATVSINNLNLGAGNFSITVSLYKNLDLDNLASSEYYDLIDRSYFLKILVPESRENPSLIHFKQKWDLTE